MKRLLLFVLISSIALSSVYTVNGENNTLPSTSNFYLELTKIGNSMFDFCTYESAGKGMTRVPLSNGISFDFLSDPKEDKDTKAQFGVYWDLYTQEETNITISITFSAFEDGSAEYMLENKESRGTVLNYSVSGTAYVDENTSTSGDVSMQDLQIQGITVPDESIDSTSFSNRTVEVYNTAASAFVHVSGSAQMEAELRAPYEGSDQSSFFGGEYTGYAILTITSGGN